MEIIMVVCDQTKKKQIMENLLIYGSIFDMLDELTNEEAGLLFKALNSFRKGEEVEFEDRYLKGIWKGILPNLNKLKENYDSKVKANQENGKKGGRPKKINDGVEPSKPSTQNKAPEATIPTKVIPKVQVEVMVTKIEENLSTDRIEVLPLLKAKAKKYFNKRYSDEHFDKQLKEMSEIFEDLNIRYVDELTEEMKANIKLELKDEDGYFYKVQLFEVKKELTN